MSTQQLYVTKFNCPNCKEEYFEFICDEYEKCIYCGADLSDNNWTEEDFKISDYILIINMDAKGNINYKFEEV